jgi:hypothetical protein
VTAIVLDETNRDEVVKRVHPVDLHGTLDETACAKDVVHRGDPLDAAFFQS